MSTQIINCPNCGGAVEFRASAYLPGVCTYCQAKIAPPKHQSSEADTKLEDNKAVPTIKMPKVNEPKSRGIPVKAIVVVVLVVIIGYATKQKLSSMGASSYYEQLRQKIAGISCSDPSIKTGSKFRVQFGSFRAETFLVPQDSHFTKDFSQCVNNAVALDVMKAPLDELILGSVLIEAKTGGSLEAKESSLALYRISSSWKMDIHNEQKSRSGLAEALEDLQTAKSEMWQCWVKYGVLERPGNKPFNQYTGSNIRVPIRLSVNHEGRITNTYIVSHKARKDPSTWRDQPDFQRCLQEATADISGWPEAPRGENYFVGLQMNVSQSPWK